MITLKVGDKCGPWTLVSVVGGGGARCWADGNGTMVEAQRGSPWYDGPSVPKSNSLLLTPLPGLYGSAPIAMESSELELTDTGDEMSRLSEAILPARFEAPCESCRTTLWSDELVCWRCGWRR